MNCQVAGVRLELNRPVASDGPAGPAYCLLRFGEVAEGWLNIPNPATGTRVSIRPDGKEAVISSDPAEEAVRAQELRWAAPFIAALQGQTVLHASAVERAGRIYAFIAGSGTGKSTISSALERRGWNKVVDDLLPECLGPPAALYFLCRGGGPSLRQLPGDEAFAELAANGFGELATPALWETHFRYYCELLEHVPCYQFTVPDSLARVEESAQWWEENL